MLFPSPGDLSDLGIEPGSPALQADTLSSEPPGKPLLAIRYFKIKVCILFFFRQNVFTYQLQYSVNMTFVRIVKPKHLCDALY